MALSLHPPKHGHQCYTPSYPTRCTHRLLPPPGPRSRTRARDPRVGHEMMHAAHTRIRIFICIYIYTLYLYIYLQLYTYIDDTRDGTSFMSSSVHVLSIIFFFACFLCAGRTLHIGSVCSHGFSHFSQRFELAWIGTSSGGTGPRRPSVQDGKTMGSWCNQWGPGW